MFEKIQIFCSILNKCRLRVEGPAKRGKYICDEFGNTQYIYFLSSGKKIKKGDWVIDNNKIARATEDFPATNWCMKIIASSDPALGLPRPIDEFLQIWVDYYNNGNAIMYVDVEYELDPNSTSKWYDKDFVLKVDPKFNTINIGKHHESDNLHFLTSEMVKIKKKMSY